MKPPSKITRPSIIFLFLQEENFTRATEFIPQRWIPEERPKDWVHKAQLVVPFGSGKRICPGKRLAEQEIHIITGKLFQKLQEFLVWLSKLFTG